MITLACQQPEVPAGRMVRLPHRGSTFVRDIPGPAGAPVLVLLHGWTATADLNWGWSFAALARWYRVVALDHRGHGRGLQSGARFDLETCADDAAALLDELRIDRAVVVGYSMGGPIAQLLWRRRPDLVAGLVLCATSDHFVENGLERLLYPVATAATALSRFLPLGMWAKVAQCSARRRSAEDSPLLRLAVEAAARHDWTAIFEAGVAISVFDSRPWVSEIDAPTAVVVTTDDHVVPSERQVQLCAAIAGATLHPSRGAHDVCINHAERFVPVLVEACHSVVARIDDRTAVSSARTGEHSDDLTLAQVA